MSRLELMGGWALVFGAGTRLFSLLLLAAFSAGPMAIDDLLITRHGGSVTAAIRCVA